VHVNIKSLPQSRMVRPSRRGNSRKMFANSASKRASHEVLRGVPQAVAQERDFIMMNKYEYVNIMSTKF
jgi:hypothetical protein